jgi:hypothetical protein
VAALTDEILMAYADGVLDASTRAQIEALLQANPDAMARVQMFRATGVALGKLYSKPLKESIPAHLVDFVMNHGKEAVSATPAKSRGRMQLGGIKNFVSQTLWDRLIPRSAGWQLAAASVAALGAGFGAGYFVRGGDDSGSGLASFSHGQIFAGSALRNVLETKPSGQEARIAGGTADAAVVRATVTFKTKTGQYCREYEVLAQAGGQFAGLACRLAGGAWVLDMHVPAPPKSTPAAGEKLVDPVVDRMIEGDAFGKEEEDAAISNGWR